MDRDYTDSDENEKSWKKEKTRKDKQKGYVAFMGEDSDEELMVDSRSPVKIKKHNKTSFRFKLKEKKEKEEKRERREDASKKAHKIKKKEKRASGYESDETECRPIFAVPLALAVERSKCDDGIELPAIFRECIEFIEEHGLQCEGIYRISGVKSKVQKLRQLYNRGRPVQLAEFEPNAVASLLKQFLRELPEPVLTTALLPKFEEASTIRNPEKKLDQFKRLIGQLPTPNRLLLTWMIVHMTHVIRNERDNKMSLQNVSIVLSPTMQISHRVLYVLFTNHGKLFNPASIKRYVPGRMATKPSEEDIAAANLPQTIAGIQREISKQEELLAKLHSEVKAGLTDNAKEEKLWDIQRVITQLKRRLKHYKRQEKQEKVSSDEAAKVKTTATEETKPSEEGAPATTAAGSNAAATDPQQEFVRSEMKNLLDIMKQKKLQQSGEETSASNAAEPSGDKASKGTAGQKPEEGDASKHPGEVPQTSEAAKVPIDTAKDVPADTQRAAPRDTSEEGAASPTAVLAAPPEKATRTKSEVVGASTLIDSSAGRLRVDHPASASEQPSFAAFDEETEAIRAWTETDTTAEGDTTFADSLHDTSAAGGVFDGSGAQQQQQQQPGGSGDFWPGARSASAREEVGGELWSSLGHREVHVTESAIEQQAAHEEPADANEREALALEEQSLRLENEELHAIGDELRKKIANERAEIQRLESLVTECQRMRMQETLSDSSASESDSEDEEELQAYLQQLQIENKVLRRKNNELLKKINEERRLCLEAKVKIRMIQMSGQVGQPNSAGASSVSIGPAGSAFPTRQKHSSALAGVA